MRREDSEDLREAMVSIIDELSSHPVYEDDYYEMLSDNYLSNMLYDDADRILRQRDYVVDAYVLGETVVALSDGKRNRTRDEIETDINYLLSCELD